MRLPKLNYFLASALLSFSVGNTASVYADDTEIYLDSSGADGSQNILFNLDTSGSMGDPVDEDNNGVIDPGERSRMDVLKDAMATVLDSLPSVNAGVMRYHLLGGPILYPVAPLETAACVIEDNCTDTTDPVGIQTIVVPITNDADDAEQEGASTVILDGSSLDFGEIAAGTCSTTTGSVQVSAGPDDAESRDSGTYSDINGDLELPRDGTTQQIVGMRFRSVNIPAGAAITDARLVFEVDNDSRVGYNATVELLVSGESMAGSRAEFSITNQPKDRLADNPTNATVRWETGEFPAVDETLTSANIAGILNELVSDPVWPNFGGDDVVLLVEKDPGAAPTSTGSRELESFNGESSAAPTLTYAYESCNGTTTEVRTGLRFANVTVPQGATITSARIDFVATGAPGTGNPNFQVAMEDADDSAVFSTLSPFTGRSFFSGTVTPEDWDTGSTPPLANSWTVDTTYQTPDLTTQVQAVVSRSGWCGGNAMMFMLERASLPGDDVARGAYSRELDTNKAPVLTVTYDADNPQPGATNCTRTTIVALQKANSDDAEESDTGVMDVTSTDLEMVEDTVTQQVGLRFPEIPIDRSTVITSAKLVFTVDEVSTGAASLTVNGQLAGDANPFSTSAENISDTNLRPRTSTSVAWTPPPFALVDQTHELTGLEGIIQEIVNQSTWNAGNALAFLISGSGQRVAHAYDSSTAKAPRLVITFEGDPGTSKKTVRQRLKDVVAGLVQRGGTPIAGSMLEAAYYYRGEDVHFGRQRGEQANSDRNTRVSHFASYEANGAAETFPGNCSESNLADADCKDQVIGGGTPKYKSPIVAECQANFLVNLTDGDGFFTGSSGETNTLGDSIHEEGLINSLQAHDEDGNLVSLTNCASDTTLPDGTIFSGNSHDECSVKLAQFLHDNDQIYNSTQVLQSGSAPLDNVQSIDIYNIGFNLCGLGNVSSEDADGEAVCCTVANHDTDSGICSAPLADPTAITVLKAQAAVGNGRYFNASTVDELVGAFTEITDEIETNGTSFSGPALAASQFIQTLSRDELYFGLFEPEAKARWKGNLKKYRVCTDPDPDNDNVEDCTLREVLDDNDDPAVINDINDPDNGLFENTARSVWSANPDGREVLEGGAGGEFDDFTERLIYTEYRTGDGTAATGTPLSDAGFFFDSTNWDDLANAAIRDEVCPDPNDLTVGSDCYMRMQWVLGKDVLDEDDNPATDTRWGYGDIIHSSPVTITYGRDGSDNFIDKVIVGSNDGGVHFVNGATGEEEWVFMPRAMLAKQKDLFDNTAPNHIYGMDTTAVIGVTDANLDGIIDPGTDFVGAIVAQRRGGNNIYALDLTPTSTITANSQTLVPRFLWQINAATPGFSRLGQTWSEPVIANILLSDQTTRTVVIFGGGYDTDLDADDGSGIARNFGTEANPPGEQNTGNAVYLVDANTGDLIFSISGTEGVGVEAADIFVPEMTNAIPSNLNAFDSDGDGRVDRIYVGDTGGQVFRVDLSNVNPGSADPQGDTVVGRLANLSTQDTLVDERRFFFRPTVVQVKDTVFSEAAGGEFDYVLIGSGNRANPLDKEVSDRFYALRDVTIGPLLDSDSDNIADDYPVNIDATSRSGAPIADDGTQLVDVSTAILTGNATTRAALGWVFNFDSSGTDGEKVITSSTVFGGTLLFTSYVPDSDTLLAEPCTPAVGSANAYNLNILSAAAVLDWDAVDGVDPVTDRATSIGTGIPGGGVLYYDAEGVGVLFGTGGGVVQKDVSANPLVETYWYEESE